MKNKTRLVIILIAVCAVLLTASAFGTENRELSEKLIRLHVIANSDSDGDQALKLKVRDAVLEKAGELLNGVTDRDEAERILRENVSALCSVSRKTVSECGYDYGVSVSLSMEEYPTREYDTFSLPAGEYCSLRVIIGSGEGHNWWCVIFPPLCTEAVTDSDTAVINLSSRDINMITGKNEGYVIRFKIVDIIGRIINRMR